MSSYVIVRTTVSLPENIYKMYMYYVKVNRVAKSLDKEDIKDNVFYKSLHRSI